HLQFFARFSRDELNHVERSFHNLYSRGFFPPLFYRTPPFPFDPLVHCIWYSRPRWSSCDFWSNNDRRFRSCRVS
ncbi:hypothetical protein PFISCL1PPCAC_1189, partial [Pristionchus fissidentatus]